MAQQVERQRMDQAYVRLQAYVRRGAHERGAGRAEADVLAEQARGAFRIVNGEAQVVGADGRTPERDGSGALLSIGAWVERVRGPQPEKLAGTFGPSPVALPVRVRNPFARGSWNLTEQMRLQRRDPELAVRLRDEAAN